MGMWIAIGGGIILAGVVLFVLFAVVPKRTLARIRSTLEQRVAEEVPADQVLRKDVLALSFGLESREVMQRHGNGALVLTPTELRWLQLEPRSNDVTIPLATITTVDTAGSHLGAAYGRPLLHVWFAKDGMPDSMAWYNTDVHGWIASIEAARGGGEPHPGAVS